jgi:glycosyltransferase involved in cell wall biosynthesis
MKLPLISLIMPTMNSERFIRETLHSLVEQVYSRFELIVVDGGSTDDTLNIVESYSSGDVKIIELAPELGIAKALNVGISKAKGEFIARMDADDIAYQWRLHDQVKMFNTHPEVDLIGTGVDAFWDHQGVFRSPLLHTQIRDEFLVNNPFFHPTIMFKRKLADQKLYHYDESFFFEEDYELWGRLIPHVTCANMDQSSIRYRIRSNSTQWDPRKFRFKRKALEGFCKAFGLKDAAVIDGLAEFQCSSFIRREHYLALADYARSTSGHHDMPRLGWIHDACIREPDYPSFTRWFRSAKGWQA